MKTEGKQELLVTILNGLTKYDVPTKKNQRVQ